MSCPACEMLPSLSKPHSPTSRGPVWQLLSGGRDLLLRNEGAHSLRLQFYAHVHSISVAAEATPRRFSSKSTCKDAEIRAH